MHPKRAQQLPLNEQLASLPKMDRRALLTLWREAFGEPPKSPFRREVLVPLLAYRLQERVFGGLKPSTGKRLRELLGAGLNGRTPDEVLGLRPKPGTRFVREWKGKLHEVSVLPDGYEYDGRIYRSLSEIARLISGTRWSGPAFFGLKSRARRKAT